MTTPDFTITLVVDKPADEVFAAVNNVREWWSEGVEGSTEQLNDEFIYRYKDLHYSRQRLIEVIPAKKIVWLVIDSKLNFIKNKKEWNNTRISFDISERKGKTQIRFTHWGLIPEIECYDACSGGWNHYVGKSLLDLIAKGKGVPDKKKE